MLIPEELSSRAASILDDVGSMIDSIPSDPPVAWSRASNAVGQLCVLLRLGFIDHSTYDEMTDNAVSVANRTVLGDLVGR